MKIYILLIVAVSFYGSCGSTSESNSSTPEKSERKKTIDISYTMPEESELHEGTWLQWPHEYQYGKTFRNRLDDTWMDMVEALIKSENVHIIAYDDEEKERIIEMLEEENIPLTNIDFKIYKTDDFWVRDNGPIYVRDGEGKLVIEDWGFNGWGDKAKSENCDEIPEKIAQDQNIKYVDLNDIMINEGGAVEIDGTGSLMATKSSILNDNRNRKMTQEEAEGIFTKYLGVTHFIWLNGKAGLEITDMHIDGFARFGNKNTIVTMNEEDLLEWELPQEDINTLYSATNKSSQKYDFVKLPLTKNNVKTKYGKKLDYPGSYVNYYIANTVVLVPNYDDPYDSIANSLIQKLYPTRTVIGIDARNMYANGGMIHCVTQQQPK